MTTRHLIPRDWMGRAGRHRSRVGAECDRAFALVELLGRYGWQVSEHVVRECIKLLRRRGHLICGVAA